MFPRKSVIVKKFGAVMQDFHFPISANSTHQGYQALGRQKVRRRITPEVGRGLEKLGHALAYLEDEFVFNNRWEVAEDSGRLEAIRVLAAINRELYLECGVAPTIRDRMRVLFGKGLS
jgi:hypothetical protein